MIDTPAGVLIHVRSPYDSADRCRVQRLSQFAFAFFHHTCHMVSRSDAVASDSPSRSHDIAAGSMGSYTY